MENLMSGNAHYKEVAELLQLGKVVDSICESANKAFSLLGEINVSQKSEIADLVRWGKMYRTRHKTLLQKDKNCGGFEETITALDRHDGPIDLILLESNLFVSMFLLDRNAENLIGALYIERDQDSSPQ
jgi:hypothetical protein